MVLVIWFLILSFIFRNETIDIQFHDTYYIIGVSFVLLTFAGLTLLLGLVLELRKSQKSKSSPNKLVSFYVLVSLAFWLLNCTDNKSTVQQFNEEVSITGDCIKDISIFSKGNVNLLVVDSLLIVQKGSGKVLSIYNTNNFQLLAEYGAMGNGDLEFSAPHLLKSYSRSLIDKSPILYVYDFDRRMINKINLQGLIVGGADFHEQKAIEDRSNYYLNFYFSSDEYYVGVSEGKEKFILFDRKYKSEIGFGYTPPLDIEIESSWLYSVYRPAISVNEKEQKIAVASILIPNLEIWDFSQRNIASVNFDRIDSLKYALTEYKKSGEFDSKHFIVDIDSNEDNIIGLNYNNSSTAIYKNYIHQDMNFLQFDWDGNLLKKYILADNKFVESFAVDFINKKVYCYLPHEKEHNLYVYNIK